jgi:hypothetical protein
MLLVFLMAAMIAIALYKELPRVAFEAQRTKEQLLMERGQQYTRAIQLFVRKMSRYPATIEELESTNNIRFLRKRYVDPMTGKDKWRLIHVNGGVLTDSIIPKNKPGQNGDQQQANTNTFIGEGPVMGATNDPSQQQINPGMRRRASDDRPVVTQEVADTPQPDTSDDNSSDADNSDTTDNNSDDTPAPGTPAPSAAVPGMPNPQTPGMPGAFPRPGAYPGQPGFNPTGANQQFGMPGTPNQPGMGGAGTIGGTGGTGQSGDGSSGSSVYAGPSLGSQPAPVNTGSPTGMPGQPGFPGQPGGMPGQPGFPGRPGMFPGSQPGAFPGQQQGGFPGSQPGGNPIMNSLTNPSNMQPQTPGGLPGMGGTQMGGGIAGVASEYKGPSIKIYNERKKYNEWEFVYDQSKDRGLAGMQKNGGAPGTPAGQMGSMPGQQPGQQQTGMGAGGSSLVAGGSSFGSGGSSFGSGGSSFGSGGSSFGSGGTGFGQSPQQPQQPQQPPN